MLDHTTVLFPIILTFAGIILLVATTWPLFLTTFLPFIGRLLRRLFRRHPSYYRRPRYTESELNIPTLNSGPNQFAHAIESTTHNYRANEIRTRLDLPPSGRSELGIRYEAISRLDAALHSPNAVIRILGAGDTDLPMYQQDYSSRPRRLIMREAWLQDFSTTIPQQAPNIPEIPPPAHIRPSFESAIQFYSESVSSSPEMDNILGTQSRDDTASVVLPDDDDATIVSRATTLVEHSMRGVSWV